METIDIKYTVPSLRFNKKPAGNQSFTVSYSKVGSSTWTNVGSAIIVKPDGSFQKQVIISGLEDDSDYQIRFINESSLQVFITSIHTMTNFSVGDNHLYGVLVQPKQQFIWNYENLLKDIIPADTDLVWYFDMSDSPKANIGLKSSMDLYGNTYFSKRSTANNEDESYLCYSLDGGYMTFPIKYQDPSAEDGGRSERIYANDLLNQGNSQLILKFYLDDNFSNAEILHAEKDGKKTVLGIDSSLKIYQNYYYYDGNQYTATIDSVTLKKNTWYTLLLGFGYRDSGYTVLLAPKLFEGNVTTNLITNIGWSYSLAHIAYDIPVYIGNPDGSTKGLNICKIGFTYAKTGTSYPEAFSANTRDKIIANYSLIPSYRINFAKVTTNGDIVYPIYSYLRVGDFLKSTYNIELPSLNKELTFTITPTSAPAISYMSEVIPEVECAFYENKGDSVPKQTVLVPVTNMTSIESPIDFTVPAEYTQYKYVRFNLRFVLKSGTITEAFPLNFNTRYTYNKVTAIIPASKLYSLDGTHVLLEDSIGSSLSEEITCSINSNGTLTLNFPKLASSPSTIISYTLSMKDIVRITDNNISYSMPESTTWGWGYIYMELLSASKNYGGRHIRFALYEDISFTDLDYDFENNFDTAISAFKEVMLGKHDNFGGYSGGLNANLIYASRQEGCIILEVHGDSYDGNIIGVKSYTESSNYTGYGGYLTPEDNVYNDPTPSKARVRRVGSGIETKKFFNPNRRVDIWAMIPKGTEGVCFAPQFYFHSKIPRTSCYYDTWTNTRGYQKQVRGDSLIVTTGDKLEIPSINNNYLFSSREEVNSYWFYTKALSNDYTIAITAKDSNGTDIDSELVNRGTWRVDNYIAGTDSVVKGDTLTWVKVSDDYQVPDVDSSYSSYSFSKGHGIYDKGTGCSKDQDDYTDGKEMFVSLKGNIDINLADGKYHKYTILRSYPKTKLYIDDVLIRECEAFPTPTIDHILIAAWFPSVSPEEYTPDGPQGTYAGQYAPFSVSHIKIKRISISITEGGSSPGLAYYKEDNPEEGLRLLI